MVDDNQNNGIQSVTLYLQISNVDGADLKAEHLQSVFVRMLGSSLTSMRVVIHCRQKEDRGEAIFFSLS